MHKQQHKLLETHENTIEGTVVIFLFFLLGTKHKHKVHLIDAVVDGRSVPLMDAVCLSVGFISSIHLRESTQKPFETGEALQKKKKCSEW